LSRSKKLEPRRTLKDTKVHEGKSWARGVIMSEAGERRSGFRIVLDFLKRLLRRKPAAPGDPYAYAMAPVRRGPKGRSGAAVAEIEEESFRSFPPRHGG